jgi:hypothetical protein
VPVYLKALHGSPIIIPVPCYIFVTCLLIAIVSYRDVSINGKLAIKDISTGQ